ncbi:MAG: gamma-glutamyltransferase, partial [Solirubrobacterales bacterium]|nr:gamma-glutamyltransferase [Solirubrobacterales bacterium]
LALVHRDGNSRPFALNASGRAGSGADPDRLRAARHTTMPPTGEASCATVPGCVDGWLALHQRFCRLPLSRLLAPARRYAAEGFAASPSLAAACEQLAGVDGADDYTAHGPTYSGQLLRRSGVARTLESIARDGRRGFYEGEFGHALIELGGGEFSAGDFARDQADWVEPLAVEAFGRRVWSLPPNSQGYLLLASAAIASGLELPEPDDPGWAHLLIECSRVAAADREMVWHEASSGEELIGAPRIEAMRERIGDRRLPERSPDPVPGGTTGICVVDDDRTAISMLQSNYLGWGSLLFVPGPKIALHNRGSSFSLEPGHPAEYRPGRRPPHTLAPLVVTDGDGALESVLATRGGDLQPQILLQLLARVYGAGQSPAQAIAAGRWALVGSEVELEGQASERWFDGLIARGHRVHGQPAFSEQFGEAQLIVRRPEHLAAASDPRSPTWAVGAL